MDRVLDNLTRLGENAAIFLVPTFIFGLYGSNTWLPGQGSTTGFAVMVAIVISVTLGSVYLIQRWQRERGPGTGVEPRPDASPRGPRGRLRTRR
jgi:Mg2+ and Co2+ transporter CorA